MEFSIKVIGRVHSPLQSRETTPKQGEEGSPIAVLVFDPNVQEALSSIGRRQTAAIHLARPCDRQVLRVHPRDDRTKPLHGVFSTRSPDRPNPIGLHRVTVVSILDALRFQVRDLEALDQTPIIDVKAALEGLRE